MDYSFAKQKKKKFFYIQIIYIQHYQKNPSTTEHYGAHPFITIKNGLPLEP